MQGQPSNSSIADVHDGIPSCTSNCQHIQCQVGSRCPGNLLPKIGQKLYLRGPRNARYASLCRISRGCAGTNRDRWNASLDQGPGAWDVGGHATPVLIQWPLVNAVTCVPCVLDQVSPRTRFNRIQCAVHQTPASISSATYMLLDKLRTGRNAGVDWRSPTHAMGGTLLPTGPSIRRHAASALQ
jgi:hypothetical protein